MALSGRALIRSLSAGRSGLYVSSMRLKVIRLVSTLTFVVFAVVTLILLLTRPTGRVSRGIAQPAPPVSGWVVASIVIAGAALLSSVITNLQQQAALRAARRSAAPPKPPTDPE